MWANSDSKLGRGRSSGGESVAAQPTCMWALGLSTARNDASSAESRCGGIGGNLPRDLGIDPSGDPADARGSLQNFQMSPEKLSRAVASPLSNPFLNTGRAARPSRG